MARRVLPLMLTASLVLSAGGTAARAEDALLAQDLSAVFAARTARIAPYVAWTYGWATSYANSYLGAYHILKNIWSSPPGERGDVIGVLRGLQQRSLRERVSRPTDDAAQISQLIDRHTEASLYVLAAQAVSSACADKGKPACVARKLPHLKAEGAAIMAERRDAVSRSRETRELAAMLDIKQADDVDVLHAVRPITTRLVIIILRFTEFASIVLLVTGSLRRVYVPDTAITRFAVALAASWSLDYGLLRVERALNEEGFRAGLEAQISAQEVAIREFVSSRIAGYEDRFIADAAAIVGEPG